MLRLPIRARRSEIQIRAEAVGTSLGRSVDVLSEMRQLRKERNPNYGSAKPVGNNLCAVDRRSRAVQVVRELGGIDMA